VKTIEGRGIDALAAMNRKIRGRQYEQAATDFLRQSGYQIITTNYRFGRNEIDIICAQGGELVFVEVKGSASDAFGDPVYRVNESKRQAIIKTAQGFIQQSIVPYDSYRFDVVIVIDKDGETRIDHVQAAFTA
jgi:putative endonuclease